MRIKGLLFAVSTLFTLAACTQKNEGAAADAGEEAAPPRPVSAPGVVLTSTSKWVEKSEGLMAYAGPAEYGEAVEVLLAQDGGAGLEKKYVTKRAVREKIEGERDFYQVKDSEGKEFWVQDLLIAVDAELCIVTGESALLYTKPDLASINSKALVLPQYAIMGLHRAESTEDFICVSGYITEFKNSPVIARQFVKTGLVSVDYDPEDIQAIKLYHAAMASKNDIAKRELLNNAAGLWTSFRPLIWEAIEAMDAPQFVERPTTRILPVAAIDGGGPGEKVNLRDKPGLRDSKVVAQLNHDTLVIITAETTEMDTIDNVTDYWYRVHVDGEEGEEGWIFGAYLGPA
jgi:hypothetical protein